MSVARTLPRWADLAVIPAVNTALAFVVAGLVVLAVGESPLQALGVMLDGALASAEGLGYTLYYATNYVFTGLAVAVALRAGLFNIGGEGQATIGCLGVGLVLLAFDRTLPVALLLPLAVLAAALSGAGWALVPALLQAWRGSHVVITTIMFNFLAGALMVFLMVNVLIAPGTMSPESRDFAPEAALPMAHELLGALGVAMPRTPLNISGLLALAACAAVWWFLGHTARGYELRAVGGNPEAAAAAGIDPRRVIVAALCLSGALAGLVGVNEIMGVHHRLLLNVAAGYGFAGIAVSLVGRNHPLGILLSSLLFGVLTQGGAELSFEFPAITREMVQVIQGFVILLAGALAHLNRPWLERLFQAVRRQ